MCSSTFFHRTTAFKLSATQTMENATRLSNRTSMQMLNFIAQNMLHDGMGPEKAKEERIPAPDDQEWDAIIKQVQSNEEILEELAKGVQEKRFAADVESEKTVGNVGINEVVQEKSFVGTEPEETIENFGIKEEVRSDEKELARNEQMETFEDRDRNKNEEQLARSVQIKTFKDVEPEKRTENFEANGRIFSATLEGDVVVALEREQMLLVQEVRSKEGKEKKSIKKRLFGFFRRSSFRMKKKT